MFAIIGSLLAGLYGVIHDQITYSISREYFTNLKFSQFENALFSTSERLNVAIIGFLATHWVGLVCGWFLARWYVPSKDNLKDSRQILIGFLKILLCAALFGVMGGILGYIKGPHADYSAWQNFLQARKVSDQWAFIRVAYIHNGGYLGALVGLIATLIFQKRHRENA